MSPLEGMRKDLDARIYEKLALWVQDSLSLYRMGGLRKSAATQDIFVNLMIVLCKLAVAYNIDREHMVEGMMRTMAKLDDELEIFKASKEMNDE